MKVEIWYEFDAKCPPHKFACVEVRGEKVVRAGYTWEQARRRLLDDLPILFTGGNYTPPRETVEHDESLLF